jgi:hypothetical protein
MKKYILIQNDGEIESNSFELIGASTKRGDTSKIGFFGSGLKYSIAYMMRNNIDFKIFSGENELAFTVIPVLLKGQTFDRICINGNPTSYTITMGTTWTEDWFVLREIYCNAIDEGSCQMVKETENVNPVAGKTRIYIELTESLKNIVENWDAYFSTDKEPLHQLDSVYTSYFGSDSAQPISIFKKTSGVIFRKEIRVHVSDKLNFDYGFSDVQINEDRTASKVGGLQYALVNIISSFPSENYIASILRSGKTDSPCDEYKSMSIGYAEKGYSEQWLDFSKKYLLVLEENAGKYVEEIQKSKKEFFLIPAYFAKNLKSNLPEVMILGLGSNINGIGMNKIEPTEKMNYLLKEVINCLGEMRYQVPYDITIVEFDDNQILGQADIAAKEIYLSDRVFDLGRREIALAIMEEVEHIVSGKKDETRGFQTHIFSSWLTTMENNAALFF